MTFVWCVLSVLAGFALVKVMIMFNLHIVILIVVGLVTLLLIYLACTEALD